MTQRRVTTVRRLAQGLNRVMLIEHGERQLILQRLGHGLTLHLFDWLIRQGAEGSRYRTLTIGTTRLFIILCRDDGTPIREEKS